MPRLETLSEVQRKMLQMFPCMEHDDTPWTPMQKPLSESRVALVTSAGAAPAQRQALRNRPHRAATVRTGVVPRGTPAAEIIQSHVSIGFDHASIYRDINVTYPIDRLEELKEQGVIGSLADNYYSYMGALRDTARVYNETGPEVAKKMLDEGVEVVFLTPT